MILVAQVECEYPESEFLIFESSGNLEKTGKLLVARSLVSITKDKLVPIRVCNPTCEDVKVYAKTCIGNLEVCWN